MLFILRSSISEGFSDCSWLELKEKMLHGREIFTDFPNKFLNLTRLPFATSQIRPLWKDEENVLSKKVPPGFPGKVSCEERFLMLKV